ncbi:hypothetical protein AB1Y20_014230 [Prymnesium parvum]|uniref:Transmembrane protein n=1 Tax=Prymnesium parvum TaxID=97485 RepID=A0AB34IFN3_PRYPA
MIHLFIPHAERPGYVYAEERAHEQGKGAYRLLPTLKPENVKTVFGFLEGAAVFAVSRTWADLISTRVLSLSSVTYCGGFLAQECIPTADSSAMFLYALCIIPIAGMCKQLVEYFGLTKLPGMWDDIPMILNYIVGWAWGNALLQLLHEITLNDDGLAMITSDGKRNFFFFNAFFSLVVTIVSGLVIILIMPFTKEVECGDGDIVNFLEDALENIWSMVSRGCAVSVMVLWYYTISTIAFLYVPPGHILAEEVQLLYAISVTALGAQISVYLEKQEERLKKDPKNSPTKVEALVGFSDLTQSVIGYVVGCAWSDFVTTVFTCLGEDPEPIVMLQNFAIAFVISAGVVYYLLAARAKYELNDAGSREATEQYFVINSMAFFVGWIWLVATRNVFAQYCILFERGVIYFDSRFGLTFPPYVGDSLAVFTFSPLLTVFFFWLSGSIITKIEKSLGAEHPDSKAKSAKMLKDNWKKVKH